MKIYKKQFDRIKISAPKRTSPSVANKLDPNTNLVTEILKFSALVKTERDVKLIAVPAHQPIR